MLIFLDTEFTGLDQAKPDLVSIGLVDETGREFYAELPEAHWTVQCNEWVVVMRAGRYTLDTIAKSVHAKSRQAIAKALATVPKRYRFDVTNDTTRHRDIDNLEFFSDRVRAAKAGSSAHAHFMELIGPAAAIAILDPDISEIMLNDDGALWSDSASAGMKKIGSISAPDAAKLIQFAAQNFCNEAATDKEIILLELPFVNARFTAVLPPVVDRPVFGIRKGT
jgi:hypothetical protein